MTVLQADGTKQVFLSKRQFDGINDSLRRFYRQTKCGVIMLSDASGLAVAQCGTMDPQKMSLLSTVAAGNHAATLEMAKLIGEVEGFKVLFHEGDQQNVYIKGVDSSFFVVVVFAEQTTFGMIRLLTEKTIDELREVLGQSDDSEAIDISTRAKRSINDSGFQDELGARLDSVLFTKKDA